MLYAGIDSGSRTIKVVLVEDNPLRMLARAIADQGIHQGALAEALLGQALAEADRTRGELAGIVATGYGRDTLACADTTITEITCHARGVYHLQPEARTVIDIGGQDSKLLRLAEGGKVRDFVMNDRCAAGTGRFLEVVATRLGVSLEGLGQLADSAGEPAPISSMCVVFAETEIIGLLASGTPPANIAAGVQAAIATRIAAMAGRHLEDPVVFTGGVAQLPAMTQALAHALRRVVQVCPHPSFSGALGAALLAATGR